MSINEKTNIFLNESLLSGSSDTFRTVVGGCWQAGEDEYGEFYTRKAYAEATDSPIASIHSNAELSQDINDEDFLPNTAFPVRLIGNNGIVESDKHWKSLLFGGTYKDELFSSILNKFEFNDFYHQTYFPYTKAEDNSITDNGITKVVEATYEYNTFNKDYQTYIETLDSELLIPNLYLSLLYDTFGEEAEIDTDVSNFVTFDGKLSKTQVSEFANDIGLIDTSLSGTTMESIQNRMQNIFVDENSIFSEEFRSVLSEEMTRTPFYSKITVPTYEKGGLVDSIIANGHSQKVLQTLKDVFTDNVGDLPPRTLPHNSSTDFISASIAGQPEYTTMKLIASQDAREIDYIDFLQYTYNNYSSATDDGIFVGVLDDKIRMLTSTDGTYRYINSLCALSTINDVTSFLNNEANYKIDSIEDLYTYPSKHNEVLAYRVEKISGAPTGDSQSQSVTQNYWIFNNVGEYEDFTIADSQVIYGETYQYNVYLYRIVVGIEYSFDDFALTRQIGRHAADAGNNRGAPEDKFSDTDYCLEFYDPDTGDTSEQLYKAESNLAEVNQFASNSQILSDHKYIADFILKHKPSVRLMEIPILSKEVSILDHPPNIVQATPYQHYDSSKRVGFSLQYDSFNSSAHTPESLTKEDAEYLQKYKNSNDITYDSAFPKETVSPKRTIEVYRIATRPTSYIDFDNNLIQSIDLRYRKNSFTKDSTRIEDKISTNRKYYYTFRAVNENGSPGQISQIYEVELINDGGYEYLVADVLFEKDLKTGQSDKTSIATKKLIQLQPNISHILFDDSEVDYSDTAEAQIDKLVVGTATDTIWDKSFKLRLTSKKTGRKIDLNITYTLRNE